jgi:CheY-like chemotaxis protein
MQEHSAPRAAAPTAAERRPVLVVDDDPSIRALVSDCLLLEQGPRPVQASDGRGALACVAAERPALVVLDPAMPGLGGWRSSGASAPIRRRARSRSSR